MQLIDLIHELEGMPQNAIVPFGFGEPHSYRGIYAELSFEPHENAKISDMLAHAKSALNSVFTGYKGGEFKMTEQSSCYIDYYDGCLEECIGMTLINMWKSYLGVMKLINMRESYISIEDVDIKGVI